MANQRSFLKWAGNKYSIIDTLKQELPSGTRLIECFAGSGAAFLNMDQFDSYVLNDINPDLINLFKILKRGPKKFIHQASKLFVPQNNQAAVYYQLRDTFNNSIDPYEKSLIFIYLNRHGYNGLCRYNLSGGYNVPMGEYRQPYFPEAELHFFAQKLKCAKLTNFSFHESFRAARKGQTIYADPPFTELNATSNFVGYAKGGFTFEDQKHLVKLAIKASNRGVNVVISNHDTPITRKLYESADSIKQIMVQRYISPKGESRKKVPELLVHYRAK